MIEVSAAALDRMIAGRPARRGGPRVFRLVARAARERVEYTLHAASPGPGLPGDAVVDLTRARIHMDPDTVRLIRGARLDFVPGSAGGFRLLPPDPTT